MVVGDMCSREAAYMTNRGQQREPVQLQPGLHGFSNGTSLQQEWAKVLRGKAMLAGDSELADGPSMQPALRCSTGV